MANPATIADVTSNFERPLSAGETAVVPAWLNTAWSRFKKAIPGTEARMALLSTSESYMDVLEVRAVLAEMVIRRLRNPDALRTWSDDSYGQTIDKELSSGKIYVTDDERAQFALPGTAVANGMYSIQVSRF